MWTIFVLIYCTHTHTHTHTTPLPLPKFTVYCICTVWLLFILFNLHTKKDLVKYRWERLLQQQFLTVFKNVCKYCMYWPRELFSLGSCQKCSEYCTRSPNKKSVVWNLCVPFALSHNQWLVQCSAIHTASIHICLCLNLLVAVKWCASHTPAHSPPFISCTLAS